MVCCPVVTAIWSATAKTPEGFFDKIYLNTKVAGARGQCAGIKATLEGVSTPRRSISVALISIGRRPNAQNLASSTRKFTSRGFIRIDRQQRTDDPTSLRSATSPANRCCAHKAAREAKVAVEAIAGEPAEFDSVAIPAVVFTDPEIAWCGLTETQAKAEGRERSASRSPGPRPVGAQTLGRTGLTKLIYDPETERVLGVASSASGAGELIAEGARR